MRKQFYSKTIFLYLSLYFVLNLLFLGQFPFMHSDESWLSGLTRAMMQGGLNTAEPFFDLRATYPNAISIFFNLLQMPFISVFGYSLTSVRLISLIFGTAALLFFYLLVLHFSGRQIKSLIATIILSLDIQFIYAAHFARQDIIIAFGVVAVFYYIVRFADEWSYKRDIAAGLIVGLMAGIHPNSLMVAFCTGSLYLYYIFVRQLRVKNLLLLVFIVTCFAGMFIGFSVLFDRGFFAHYSQYGSTLGVDESLLEKIKALPNYFLKLYYMVSGTYYTPPIQVQLILFAAGISASCIYSLFNREMLKILLPVLGVIAAVVLIGRYSQPAVIILFPLCYLLIFCLFDKLFKSIKIIGALLLGGIIITISAVSFTPYLNNNYENYLSGIKAEVPKDSRVLANLNCEYAFDCSMLLDYRNLAYLGEMTFEEYIRSRGIEYIIYPEEMTFIYNNRPVWNIIYGNLYPYYEDMTRFLETSCTQIKEFKSPYAMRIAGYADTREWEVKVYRVTEED